MRETLGAAKAKVWLSDNAPNGDEERTEFKGRKGVWRTLPNGVHVFLPDDATSEELDSIIDRYTYGGPDDIDEKSQFLRDNVDFSQEKNDPYGDLNKEERATVFNALYSSFIEDLGLEEQKSFDNAEAEIDKIYNGYVNSEGGDVEGFRDWLRGLFPKGKDSAKKDNLPEDADYSPLEIQDPDEYNEDLEKYKDDDFYDRVQILMNDGFSQEEAERLVYLGKKYGDLDSEVSDEEMVDRIIEGMDKQDKIKDLGQFEPSEEEDNLARHEDIIEYFMDKHGLSEDDAEDIAIRSRGNFEEAKRIYEEFFEE